MKDQADQQIVFFEHNPFMSVELLDLLDNYKIACFNDDETSKQLARDWDVVSYGNREFIEEPESDQVAEILLGDKDFLGRVAPEGKGALALFFYMNPRMDELRRNAGLSLLLPDFDLQERVGSKIYLAYICSTLGLPQNRSRMRCSAL